MRRVRRVRHTSRLSFSRDAAIGAGRKWAEGPMVCSPTAGRAHVAEGENGPKVLWCVAQGRATEGSAALGVCPSIWPPQRGIGVSGHRPNSRPNHQVIHLGMARHPTMWGPRTYGGAPFGRSAAGYTT